MNEHGVVALTRVLGLLSTHGLRGLFFLTGHFAEELERRPALRDALSVHLIGYHSSGHSVDPIIPKFCDVADYAQATAIARERETSHIDPLTGVAEGDGGVHAVRAAFPEHRVESFRAPGYAWSPPHLEALRDLGIPFDFSTDILPVPFVHKGITFYPRNKPEADLHDGYLEKEVLVLAWHPNGFASLQSFDHFYYHGNPRELGRTVPLSEPAVEKRFADFDRVLRKVAAVDDAEVTPEFEPADRTLERIDFGRVDDQARYWPSQFFGYEPVHLRAHLTEFFTGVPTTVSFRRRARTVVSAIPLAKRIYSLACAPGSGDVIRRIVERPLVERFLGRGVGTVLDCGCGSGLYLRMAARRARLALGLDFQKRWLERARAAAPNAKVALGDSESLPVRTAAADTALCLQVLAHLENDAKAVQELARVTKKGGSVIVSVPLPPFFQPGEDRALPGALKRDGYSEQQIESMLRKAGLEPVRSRCCFRVFSRMAARLNRWFVSRAGRELPPLALAGFALLDRVLPLGPASIIVVEARKAQ